MAGAKRKKNVLDTSEKRIASATSQYIEALEADKARLLQERNDLDGLNEKLKNDLLLLNEKLKNVTEHVTELEITNENLKTVIERHGPRLLCPDCFFGTSKIALLNKHFRTARHGPPGMGVLDHMTDFCFTCEKKATFLTRHLRHKHPQKFHRDAVSQLHLRRSKIKNGNPAIELPADIYNTIFVTSVRGRDDIFPIPASQNDIERAASAEPQPTPEDSASFSSTHDDCYVAEQPSNSMAVASHACYAGVNNQEQPQQLADPLLSHPYENSQFGIESNDILDLSQYQFFTGPN